MEGHSTPVLVHVTVLLATVGVPVKVSYMKLHKIGQLSGSQNQSDIFPNLPYMFCNISICCQICQNGN